MNEPDLLMPLPHEIQLMGIDAAETRFKELLETVLRARLAPMGFRGCLISGASSRRWKVVVAMGDGTPVPVTLELGECLKLDPENELGMGEDFCQRIGELVVQKVLLEAERIRNPKPPAKAPIDYGVIGAGLGGPAAPALELGSELRHILGDAAYDLDAMMRGDMKEPGATSLNPARSTPDRYRGVILENREAWRKGE